MAPSDIHRTAVPTIHQGLSATKDRTANRDNKITSSTEIKTKCRESFKKLIEQKHNQAEICNQRQIDKLSKRRQELEAHNRQRQNITRFNSESFDRSKGANSTFLNSRKLTIDRNTVSDRSSRDQSSNSNVKTALTVTSSEKNNRQMMLARTPHPTRARLGGLLPRCLAEVAARAPTDPFDFMSRWLRNALNTDCQRQESMKQMQEDIRVRQAIAEDRAKRMKELIIRQKALDSHGHRPQTSTEMKNLMRIFENRTRKQTVIELNEREVIQQKIKPAMRVVPKPKPEPLPIIDSSTSSEATKTSPDRVTKYKSAAGRWVDILGRFIDDRGRLTDKQGRLVDSKGRLIDSEGNLCHLDGFRIDETGSRVDTNRASIDMHGRRLSSQGLLLDRRNNIILHGFPTDMTSVTEEPALINIQETLQTNLERCDTIINTVQSEFKLHNFQPRSYLESSEKLLDEKGRQIDLQGRLIDNLYRLIDEKGRLIHSNGRLVNDEGQYVNKSGELVDIHGRQVNRKGTLIDEFGRQVDGFGRLIDDNNDFVNEENELVDEFGNTIGGTGYFCSDERRDHIKHDKNDLLDRIAKYDNKPENIRDFDDAFVFDTQKIRVLSALEDQVAIILNTAPSTLPDQQSIEKLDAYTAKQSLALIDKFSHVEHKLEDIKNNCEPNDLIDFAKESRFSIGLKENDGPVETAEPSDKEIVRYKSAFGRKIGAILSLIHKLKKAKKKFMAWAPYFQTDDSQLVSLEDDTISEKSGNSSMLTVKKDVSDALKDIVSGEQNSKVYEDQKKIREINKLFQQRNINDDNKSDNRTSTKSSETIAQPTGPVLEEGFRIAFYHPVLGKLGGSSRRDQFEQNSAAAKSRHSYTQGIYTRTRDD